MKYLSLLLMVLVPSLHAECNFEPGALLQYENEVLKAASAHDSKSMAKNLSRLFQAQSESEGFSRYLSSSFLRPLLGGEQIQGVIKDARYQKVAKALEEMILHSSQAAQKSFVSEFSRGDWRFYTLFCEKGNTDYCSEFLPEENTVKGGAPLLAAASMMRLKKAYQVLHGKQRELVAKRIKNLYREISTQDRLKRKFIDEIYNELFPQEIPLSMA